MRWMRSAGLSPHAPAVIIAWCSSAPSFSNLVTGTAFLMAEVQKPHTDMLWPQANRQQHKGSSGRELQLVTARSWMCGPGCGRERKEGLG